MAYIMVKSRDDLEELKEFLAPEPKELEYVINFILTTPDIVFPFRVEYTAEPK